MPTNESIVPSETNDLIILLHTVNSRYNEVLGTCKFLRCTRIIIDAFSALGENLYFDISGYFVISYLVITGVYCILIV